MVTKYELDKKITAVRFALYDLGLYLDSHPCCEQAMQLRNMYQMQLKNLIDEYEQCYGTYVLTQNDVSCWKEWVAGPWPWEYMKGDDGCVAV
ncbi:MAG: spore coat protein CotJB [Clostridia bacterium]|nr:spore coat protein CotJB [Clostridia bacterium]